MFSIMSLAALAARWTAFRAGAGRFLNGNAGIAVAVAIVVIGILVGLWWLRYDAASSATAARDATWRADIAAQRARDLEAQRARDLVAEKKAAAERAALERQRDEAAARAAELESNLAKLAQGVDAAAGDPVIFPRDLVRSLRK